MKFSICIPLYNRSKYLASVLDSVVQQLGPQDEIVMCEDVSPERRQIREIVHHYQMVNGNDRIKYFENQRNLGFDANIRELVRNASGDFCVFLGNDDVLAPGGLDALRSVAARYENVGVILRSYGWFAGDPTNVLDQVRYFAEDHIFEVGAPSIKFAFRRSCVLAGLAVRRSDAVALETDEFDGALFYQLHLVGNILTRRRCAYASNLVALCRADEVPEFGNSDKERADFTPGEYTINARVKMASGIFQIARSLDKKIPHMSQIILRDFAVYSFPWLAYHADRQVSEFKGYYLRLKKLGLGDYLIFNMYYWMLRVLGRPFSEKLIYGLRRLIGRTPQI